MSPAPVRFHPARVLPRKLWYNGRMKRVIVLACAAVASAACAFRPPAVPLVSVDPFFSIWSAADRLTDCETTHWSGAAQPVTILAELDGKQWRLCGREPHQVPALPQVSTEVRPLTTVCTFRDGSRFLTLEFLTAKFTDELDVFSRPVTYVTAQAHGWKQVKLLPTISPRLATNDDRAEMLTSESTVAGAPAISIGRKSQKPLSASGDRVRCDWGYAWLVKARDDRFLLAYDDVVSLSFLGKERMAWWRRDGKLFVKMLEEAVADADRCREKANAFDAAFESDLKAVGGWKYAKIAALAYRQSFAACKLVAGPDGQPLYFSKENDSNGCIGTVDVFYPQFPHLLLTSKTLARATLEPIMLYASSGEWPYDYAPHDVGQYPLANGQRYNMRKGADGKLPPDSSRMPVEECGNMLVCMAAVSLADGHANFASRWWPILQKWAAYLERTGYDPGEQLCTDDFAGHLAHNVNLSAKEIVALGGFAKMAGMRGDRDTAEKYSALAREWAGLWVKEAAGTGREGASRLVFGPGMRGMTPRDNWSLKYNLVWDRLFGLNLFPADVLERECAAYRRLLLPFGIPLDSRRTYTKVDWIVWSATLSGKRDDFEAIIAPLYRFADETADRIPFSDWYWADNGCYRSFIARSVIGGVFLPMLYNPELVAKYRKE